MKKAEKIFGVLAVIGLVMKFTLIPGHGLILVVSLCFLSMLYFFLGFALFNDIPLKRIFKRESYQAISPARLIGTIGLGFSFSEITFGMLFKIQHYPGSATQLVGGLFFTIIILIVALIRFGKNKSDFYKNIFTRILIVGGFGLITLLTPTDWLMRVTHRDNPEYLEQMKSQQ